MTAIQLLEKIGADCSFDIIPFRIKFFPPVASPESTFG